MKTDVPVDNLKLKKYLIWEPPSFAFWGPPIFFPEKLPLLDSFQSAQKENYQELGALPTNFTLIYNLIKKTYSLGDCHHFKNKAIIMNL